MTITYNKISQILVKAKVDNVEQSYRLPQIKELDKINSKQVHLAIDWYFNNDNYDKYFDINKEVEKLKNI